MTEGKSFFRILAEKCLMVIVVFVAFYIIGSSYGFVPQSMKDTVKWFGETFNTWIFLACFLVGAYVFVKFITRRKGDVE
jgi:uncharacterized membrane protein YjdF